LSGRTARGAVATLGADALAKCLAILAIAVVASVLDAEAYGTVVLALAVFGFADVISNPALPTTLLREPDLRAETIDTAWTLALARGVLSTALFWLLAPALAACWPEHGAVLQGYFELLALGFTLTGLQNLHVVALRRQLRFGRALLVESVSPVATSVTAIVSLALCREAWWLVVAQLVGPAAGAIASWLLIARRPRLRADRKEMRHLWAFAAPLMLNGAMGYVLVAGDHVFVEYLAGTAALGVYGMSYRWSHVGVKFLAHGLQSVLMPAYVRMRDDAERLRHAVLSALGVLTAACGVVAGLFLGFADEFFRFLGGDRWTGAGAVARALMPFVLAHGLNACLVPVFLVHGKPHWLTRVIAVQLAVFFPAMWIGFEVLGLPGLALAISAVGLGVFAVVAHLAGALIALQPRALAVAVLPSLAAAGIATLLGWLTVLPLAGDSARLFVGSTTTIVAFVAIWEVWCRWPWPRPIPARSLFDLVGMLAR
jgi:O-antigen/teichoic acid export membrane protein